MTNADLAAAVHVSPATCHRRTQRLLDDGYVRGIRAEMAPEKLDRSALVIVGVVLDRSTPESFRRSNSRSGNCGSCSIAIWSPATSISS